MVKIGVASKTIRGFESGRRNPLGGTRAAIKQALEQAGIEFLDGNVMRTKKLKPDADLVGEMISQNDFEASEQGFAAFLKGKEDTKRHLMGMAG